MTVEQIEAKIDAGQTMHIRTCLKAIEITKKTLDQFRNANRPLFKDCKDGRGFYISRGRGYDYVLESSVAVHFA